MAELLEILIQLVIVLKDFAVQLIYLALQWSLLVAWLAWALLAVNWKKTWPTLAAGAWAPVVLLAIVISLIWSSLTPGTFTFFGFLTLSNFWWQLVFVSLIVAATCFCGWLQGQLKLFPTEIELEPAASEDVH